VPVFDLVAFDLYGTLLDVSGLAAGMEPIAGKSAATLLGRWRKAQLERSWQLNKDGRYESWDRVTLGALGEAAPELSMEAREGLAQLWLTVPAFEDAEEMLEIGGSAASRALQWNSRDDQAGARGGRSSRGPDPLS
jgi:HAD superfamily hydrolase (TIGR01493 family)